MLSFIVQQLHRRLHSTPIVQRILVTPEQIAMSMTAVKLWEREDNPFTVE